VAFQSFVVLVFIWLGDGSRLNKSCLHDLGVPYHHCYRVSSPLLVEFISLGNLVYCYGSGKRCYYLTSYALLIITGLSLLFSSFMFLLD
jgi:hypothetical protein